MITTLTLKKILLKTRLLERPVYFFKKNPFYNLIRFGIWTKKYIPEVIYLETTNACNAKCYSCPRAKMDRPTGFMSWQLFEKIINDLKEIGGFGLYFVFHLVGEPLLDPLLFERIKYIKNNLKNTRIHFNTNANLMNEEKIKQILSSDLDSIIFSVDGTTKETYESIKTGLNFEKTINNVNNFFRMKRETKQKKPYTIMQMVVNDENKHQIAEYKKTWKDKADKIYIKAMLNFLVQGTSIKTKEISENQLRRCFQPVSVAAVYWDGRIGLCCWDYDHLAQLGSAQNENIIDLFNTKKYQKIRHSMLEMNSHSITPCNICSQIYGQDMDADYEK